MFQERCRKIDCFLKKNRKFIHRIFKLEIKRLINNMFYVECDAPKTYKIDGDRQLCLKMLR